MIHVPFIEESELVMFCEKVVEQQLPKEGFLDQKILDSDPFQTIDTKGVGRLIEFAVKNGRSVRKDLKIGICGEQGGEGRSVTFCHNAGLNYVSCSPFRVPIARLAAAQAAILESAK